MNPDAYQFHQLPHTAKNQFRGHHIISDQVGQGELNVVWRELERVLTSGVPGDIVEFGCYAGTTSLFIRRLLDERQESAVRAFHVYDSFEGLPAKEATDQNAAGIDFTAGKLAVSKKDFLHQFHTANLRPPIVHKGWFDDIRPEDVPEKIAFAFLDGDFYRSIYTSLGLVWPRLCRDGVVLIDDYKRPELPGPERAMRDYFQDKSMPAVRTEHSVAIIRF
jgi:O-methyltransferase